ncbi:MAG: malto-oligosyltrehalose synthase [Rhodospirillales bacterium]
MTDIPSTPRATYRVQFGPDFGFTQAEAIVPYLAALGISHLYASPYLKARPGSSHGYDITDHNAFNPEVGDAVSFDSLAAALAHHQMGQILDFVPNHMGIGKADTPWWLDVLEWGEESPYAHYFDIDWTPAKPELRGKVLVPSLGDHYGKILPTGDLRLVFDGETGTFSIWYFDNRFPVTPTQYGKILSLAHAQVKADPAFPGELLVEFELILAGFTNLARGGRAVRQRAVRRGKADRLKAQLATLVAANPRLAAAIDVALVEINGRPGDAASFTRLHRILEGQSWRLAYWRVAAEEINYRRFFQINDLAGIRIEVPEVFEAAHNLVFRLIGEGKLHGLRIDHIDGLFDPEQYLVRLQKRIGEIRAAAGRTDGDQPFYVVVEKILAAHERLRDSWPIAGTTGYDSLVRTNSLFVESAAEVELDRCYRDFTGSNIPFEELVYRCKTLAMDQELASELRVLANEFNKLTETNWLTRDYTLVGLRQAMREIVACFPVYRTYVSRGGAHAEDRRDLDWAILRGRRRSLRADTTIFDFIQGVLTTDLGRGRPPQFNRAEVQRLAKKFQQYTGPVMAKGVEDTAFYRFNRLVSLNEVGGDPLRFGQSVSACHKSIQAQAKAWPLAMLASATHDTKRGEDCRARINVLSERAEEWSARVQRWATLNARLKATVEDRPAPTANDEYLFYQTMVGAWPLECSGEADLDPTVLAAFRDRVVAYMTKAVREAKANSSWTAPQAAYEDALATFVGKALSVGQTNPFLADFRTFHASIERAGALNGLAQTVLKLTLPGVPDIYQGCELWDLSLVDPDNRRPVDYETRRQMLASIEERFADGGDVAAARSLLDRWQDGAIKLFVVWRLLALRRRHPELFTGGRYINLTVRGAAADHIFAFARRNREEAIVVAVPRLSTRLSTSGGWPLGAAAWGDTRVILPNPLGLNGGRDILTAEPIETSARLNGSGVRLAAAELFKDLPVAIVSFPLGG